MAGAKYSVTFVRHGESEWNKMNLFRGWHDVALSEEGKSDSLRSPFLIHAILQKVETTEDYKSFEANNPNFAPRALPSQHCPFLISFLGYCRLVASGHGVFSLFRTIFGVSKLQRCRGVDLIDGSTNSRPKV